MPRLSLKSRSRLSRPVVPRVVDVVLWVEDLVDVRSDALRHGAVDRVGRVNAVVVDELHCPALSELVLAILVCCPNRGDDLGPGLLCATALAVPGAVLLVERLLADGGPLLIALLGGQAFDLAALFCRRARGQRNQRGGDDPSNGIPDIHPGGIGRRLARRDPKNLRRWTEGGAYSGRGPSEGPPRLPPR